MKDVLVKPYADVEGEIIQSFCGKCWQCRQEKVNNIVGRAMADHIYYDWCVALTLTYADHPRLHHKFLAKGDFQDFIRRMRGGSNSSNKFTREIRYVVAGEYGEKKGRAHFHCLLWGRGMPPPVTQGYNARDVLPEWGLGHVWADWNISRRAFTYPAKYMLKDSTKDDVWVSYSRYPVLGHSFIVSKASEDAELKVFPNSLSFTPPMGDNKRYVLRGASERLYLDKFYEFWPEALEHRFWSEGLVEDWIYNATRRWHKWKVEQRFKSLSEYGRFRALIESHKLANPKLFSARRAPVKSLWNRALDEFFSQFDRWERVSDWRERDVDPFRIAQRGREWLEENPEAVDIPGVVRFDEVLLSICQPKALAAEMKRLNLKVHPLTPTLDKLRREQSEKLSWEVASSVPFPLKSDTPKGSGS